MAGTKKILKTKKVTKKDTTEVNPKNAKKKELTIEEQYRKLSQIEHILKRPDTYIGSLEPSTEKMWVYDKNKEKIVERVITFSPGLYKIYDEIVVNAADHAQKNEDCNKFDIDIDQENCTISVKNNGPGIPVVMHKEHNVYVPSLIFGHFLTGTSFDDDQERTTGGRNGYGAKLTNVYSLEFTVETVDSVNQKKFIQTFSNNMGTVGNPKITTCKSASYTKITFTPDLEKFSLDSITDDIFDLFTKRAYDIAGTSPGTTVIVNGDKVKFKSFKDYISKFELVPESEGLGPALAFSDLIYHTQDRWQIGIVFTPDQSFKQVSYVNSICTYNGGKHVDVILSEIYAYIKKAVAKKDKNMNVKDQTIKDNMFIFVNSIIVNPNFDSQTKDELKTTKAKLGSLPTLPPKFFKALADAGLTEQVINSVQRKDQNKLGKKAKKGTKSLSDITKLSDAPKAGTSESILCSLILPEGDSAKALAMSGLSEVDQDYFGVFALKGKVMNVREQTMSSILKNAEIISICRIMGLTPGEPCTDINKLRYGRVIIMTDQDTDGFHIKGLLLNLFHYLWPELLKVEGFITSFQTPVVKATKGKNVEQFYNMIDFENWRKTATSGWLIKYYKGLGTSTKAEAKEYFRNIDKLVKSYVLEEPEKYEERLKGDLALMKAKPAKKTKKKKKVESEEDELDENEDEVGGQYTVTKKYKDPNTEAVTLFFEKCRSDDRKGLIQNVTSEVLDYTKTKVTIPEFANKELILFSIDDCDRNICAIDGYKPGQRKILKTMFKKGITSAKKELKVGQLSGLVSSAMAYHHGEDALNGTIVGMAQKFCGASNVPVLFPDGQFGSRIQNGADAAAPRYIFTYISDLGQLLIRKEDDPVLDYAKDDDGKTIEPLLYAPILPVPLLNGSAGIGTGFSNKIPQFNPKDICAIYKAFLNEEEADYNIIPWYTGFKGTILTGNDSGQFLCYGKYQLVDSNTVRITEIPVGSTQSKSFEKYKIFLEKLRTDGKISSFTEKYNDINCEFLVTMDENDLEKLVSKKLVYSFFALCNTIRTTNMNMYNTKGVMTYYNNISEIIDEYYYFRLEVYTKRKQFLTGKLKKERDILKWKVKFIDDFIEGTISISGKKKAEIVEQLEYYEYPKFSLNDKGLVEEEDEDEERVTKAKKAPDYEYLLSLKIYNLTQEVIEALKAQLANKKEELRVVMETTEEQQWLTEIEEFEACYDTWLKTELDELNQEITVAIPKNTKRKKAKKKT